MTKLEAQIAMGEAEQQYYFIEECKTSTLANHIHLSDEFENAIHADLSDAEIAELAKKYVKGKNECRYYTTQCDEAYDDFKDAQELYDTF